MENWANSYEEYEKQRQEEEQKKKIQIEINRLGGIRAYEDFKEENYENKKVLQELSRFPKENYFLWGRAGVGKTHAAVAALRKTKGRLVSLGKISREIRASQNAYEEEKIIEKYSSGILVLDDIGSEKMTEFVQGVLYEIIDNRWKNKVDGLIVTSNLDIARLSELVGNRVVSRIIGLVQNNIIEIVGVDRRVRR